MTKRTLYIFSSLYTALMILVFELQVVHSGAIIFSLASLWFSLGKMSMRGEPWPTKDNNSSTRKWGR